MKVAKVSIDHNLSYMITKVLRNNKFFHCLNYIKLIRDQSCDGLKGNE